MSNEALAKLMLKYNSGQCSEREKAIVDNWFEKMGSISDAHIQSDQEVLKDKIWSSIIVKSQITKSEEIQSKPRKYDRWFFRIAVACTLLITLFLYIQVENAPLLSETFTGINNSFKVEVNDGEKPKMVTLSDGSSVELFVGSSIKYKPRFSDDYREVFLEGDAFFDIKKDSNRPFLVNSGHVITRVLGTSFKIEQGKLDKQQVQISVISGKVSVQFKNRINFIKPSNAFELTQNQMATIDCQNKEFELGIVETPKLIEYGVNDNKPDSFVFQGAYLEDVFKTFGQAYGIPIKLHSTSLENCPFTGDLSEMDLYNALDLISTSISGEYSVEGNTIIFNGSCD